MYERKRDTINFIIGEKVGQHGVGTFVWKGENSSTWKFSTFHAKWGPLCSILCSQYKMRFITMRFREFSTFHTKQESLHTTPCFQYETKFIIINFQLSTQSEVHPSFPAFNTKQDLLLYGSTRVFNFLRETRYAPYRSPLSVRNNLLLYDSTRSSNILYS